MKSLLSILFIALSITSFGQPFKKDLKSFTELKISRGIEATLVHSDAKELNFDVKGVSKSDIIIEQDNDRLYIKVKTKALWELMQEFNWWVKVTIPYQTLETIDLTTGATVKSDGIIESSNLFIKNKMGAEADLELKVTKLSVDTSMGSITKLGGMAKEVNINANMGAVVKAFDLKSKYSTIESNMGAVVSVFCNFEFDGSASMGGTIKLKGTPENMFISETLGAYVIIID